jgi:hypothetical protein
LQNRPVNETNPHPKSSSRTGLRKRIRRSYLRGF